MRGLFFILCLFSSISLLAQGTFDGPVGALDCKAIYKDSSIFISWVSSCKVERGWINIDDKTLGKVDFGTSTDGIGKSDGLAVSLGDGGVANVFFDGILHNGSGPDFAIFENAFSDDFLELAFVEVSSDGINYVRFPATSQTQFNTQIGPFGSMDPTNLNNLAGKYRMSWGTPFDLEELRDSSQISIDSIISIRVIDVVGSIKNGIASFDSKGNVVNDPYPTDFEVGGRYNGGFDLDAVGLIHYRGKVFLSNQNNTHSDLSVNVYPNPMKKELTIRSTELTHYSILSSNGILLKEDSFRNEVIVDVEKLNKGIYFILLKGKDWQEVRKLLKE